MTRVVRELGLNRSYFTQRWSRPPATFDAGLLVVALRSLGVDVAHFFREIYPAAAGGEIWEGPEPVEERATNATRRAVGLASRRMRDELGLVVEVDAGDVEGGETAVSGDPGPSLGAEWLEDLDGRRQTEPEAVIAELAAHLHRVEPALLLRALGIGAPHDDRARGGGLRQPASPAAGACGRRRCHGGRSSPAASPHHGRRRRPRPGKEIRSSARPSHIFYGSRSAGSPSTRSRKFGRRSNSGARAMPRRAGRGAPWR